jgi:hypothetical protein
MPRRREKSMLNHIIEDGEEVEGVNSLLTQKTQM